MSKYYYSADATVLQTFGEVGHEVAKLLLTALLNVVQLVSVLSSSGKNITSVCTFLSQQPAEGFKPDQFKYVQDEKRPLGPTKERRL